ncbi:multicopper oxidase family protein [Cylindrospermum sp. FACHB-282]|uniref:multicopper oxidase family protein n=1 Tax=Cylindrospermum sp. FACHB-282 TaxID=2692794 RepID=UPI001681FE95|nr:multicopper oxidase family protein [Cylindrospermum sp. FACHB-282]MBD2385047.1 multicopper oxidase domain-containing protein [Cylindrospermum sp. FACHB-282]
MGKRLFNILCVFAAAVVLVITPISAAYAASLQIAQLADNASEPNPCAEKPIDLKTYGGAEFQNPREILSENGVLETPLEVKYGYNKIAGCSVHLRSYNGELVGPTLRVKPKDLININLINRLPPNPLKTPTKSTDPNTPHDFNTTNFHTHGFHVSPSDDSDNVLKLMPPKAKEEDPDPSYEIKIQLPSKHPAGTYWYHAHKHGSTALQVSSGMGGALIVEGGLDELPEIKNAQEKIFVFQQISYDTKGEIENYDGFGVTPVPPDSFNFVSKWSLSKRQTTINGQIYPTIRMRPGEVQRWRFIHAGISDTIELALQYPNHKNIPLHEIAVDGITLGKRDSWDELELEPGYRSDVLVQAEKVPGIYHLVDIATTPEKSLRGVGEPGQYLAKVVVEGEPVKMNLPDDSKILAVKQQDAPPDIKDTKIGHKNVEFDFYKINGEPFNPDDANPISLKLNTADEWTLSSKAANHPFHIHVNPFQYTRKDPSGNDELIWRDTLLVRQGEPVNIRSRYTLFTGEFVLHCHILDHEDLGMMKFVKIEE